MTKMNRQWLIADRPTGRPLKDSDFEWAERPARDPGPGEVQLRTLYLGFDPALKGWMENVGGYVAPTEIGETMRGSGIGEVIASNDPVRLSFLTALLADAGIDAVLLDQHTSIVEGSIGAIQRRLVVSSDDYMRARRVLSDAGEID